MDKELFGDHSDYWLVAKNIQDIFFSDGLVSTLLDFERVLDEFDIYAFKNWELGELVAGPEIKRYTVSCTFMWPENLMPDPRGARRLLPFDCDVSYRKSLIKIPIKISDPDDFIPGTHKARLVTKKIWLVTITMPKDLMNEIETGSIDLEDQEIDLQELENSYQNDVDQEQFQNNLELTPQSAPSSMPDTGGPLI